MDLVSYLICFSYYRSLVGVKSNLSVSDQFFQTCPRTEKKQQNTDRYEAEKHKVVNQECRSKLLICQDKITQTQKLNQNDKQKNINKKMQQYGTMPSIDPLKLCIVFDRVFNSREKLHLQNTSVPIKTP